ncbi:MAG: sugar transferase [Candidatus Altiarchaeota archaeon]|nr:sugar transferase [Candidatus Altiarchaeota archaeon]
MKRVFDFTASFILLITLAPIFLFIAFLIRMDSTGPIFYLSERVGLKGKRFHMFKFRTMVDSAEGARIYSTVAGDRRLTRLGSILRQHNIDELPQLFNVLKGEMSIVGPRPEVPYFVDMFVGEEKKILTVNPGMTDFASIKFNNEAELLVGSSDPDKTYLDKIRPEKLRLQLKYVEEQSLLLDVKLILNTLKLFFR